MLRPGVHTWTSEIFESGEGVWLLTTVCQPLYLEQPAQLEQDLGYPISRAIINERVRRAIQMKLAKTSHVEQAQFAWYTDWLIAVRACPFGAGMVGFKGFADQSGEAEIGYGIDPDYD